MSYTVGRDGNPVLVPREKEAPLSDLEKTQVGIMRLMKTAARRGQIARRAAQDAAETEQMKAMLRSARDGEMLAIR